MAVDQNVGLVFWSSEVGSQENSDLFGKWSDELTSKTFR